MIIEESLTAAEQTACSTLEHLLRPYVPEQYPITVSLLDKLEFRIMVGDVTGVAVELETSHRADDIVWWVRMKATGKPNIGQSIRQQHLRVDDIAPNFAQVLYLLEQGQTNLALHALCAQPGIVILEPNKGNIQL